MKKLISLFLIISMLICILVSCNKAQSDETLSDESIENSDTILETEPEQSDTEKPTEGDIDGCEFLDIVKYYGGYSLEEYNLRISEAEEENEEEEYAQLVNFPNVANTHFAGLADLDFELCRVEFEGVLDDDDNYTREVIYLRYAHEDYKDFMDNLYIEVRLNFSITPDDFFEQTNYQFVSESYGFKIYFKSDQLYPLYSYAIKLSDTCYMAITMPNFVQNESTRNTILNQCIDFAGSIRSSLDQADSNY